MKTTYSKKFNLLLLIFLISNFYTSSLNRSFAIINEDFHPTITIEGSILQEFLDNWPLKFSSTINDITVADINNDKKLEIIVATNETILVLNENCTELTNYFPNLPEEEYDKIMLNDINNDGDLELITVVNSNDLQIWSKSGSKILDISYAGSILDYRIANLNYDDFEELVLLEDGYLRIYEAPSFTMINYTMTSAKIITLENIDGDGEIEIIGAGDNFVTVWKPNFSTVYGWPKTVNDLVNELSVTDIDGDYKYEIAALVGHRWIYLWRDNGTPVSGWPIHKELDLWYSMKIADLDRDGIKEVIGVSLSVDIYNLNPEINQSNFAFAGTPSELAVADLDNNGNLELIVPAYPEGVLIFDRTASFIDFYDVSQYTIDYSSSYNLILADINDDHFIEIIFYSSSYIFTLKTSSIGYSPYPIRGVDQKGTNAFSDSDNDGFFDHEELMLGTSPYNSDTDGDGISDFQEYKNGDDPLINWETLDDDGDGLSNGYEMDYGLNYSDPDTDHDGLSDYSELNVFNTDPLNNDTDGDHAYDGWEVEHNFNPLIQDIICLENSSIEINQDEDFTTYANGSGTETDPYIITGYWILNGKISIRNVSTHFIIENCFISGGNIYLSSIYSMGNIIRNNTITQGEQYQYAIAGIFIDTTSGIEIHNNIVTNSKEGIFIAEAGGNRIQNNYFENNDIGVYLESCSSGMVVKGNTITKNGIGLRMSSTRYSKIIFNTFERNDAYAIEIIGNSYNNSIYNNYFLNNNIDNTSQVMDTGYNNLWYDTQSLTGNYWSDLGDSQEYIINENVTDPYPINLKINNYAPEIVFFAYTKNPVEYQPIYFNCTIHDDYGLHAVYLEYKINESEWYSVLMTKGSEIFYYYMLSGFSAGTIIYAKITAVDTYNNITSTEIVKIEVQKEESPQEDRLPPIIDKIEYKPTVAPGEIIEIKCYAHDNESGISSVKLSYTRNDTYYVTVDMIYENHYGSPYYYYVIGTFIAGVIKAQILVTDLHGNVAQTNYFTITIQGNQSEKNTETTETQTGNNETTQQLTIKLPYNNLYSFLALITIAFITKKIFIKTKK